MKLGSVFSGIGGVDLGFERAGVEVAWQVEIEPNCQRVLFRHWPDATLYNDVRRIDLEALEGVDVIAGGFPCQDISLAGRRAGLAGVRSGLYHPFMDVVAAIRPTWVLVENVHGLLSSKRGRDMGTVLSRLEEFGYGWAYRCLDARYFGVPQRRRRVFIVGHLGGSPVGPASVLFESEGVPWDPAQGSRSGEASPTYVASRSRVGRRFGNDILTAHSVRTAQTSSNGWGVRTEETGTLDTSGSEAVAFSFQENQRAEVIVNEGEASSLTTGGGKPGQGYPALAVSDGVRYAVRRYTPIECERLQGFPDNWTATDSDGRTIKPDDRIRMLGNAVAVPVAEWIARRLVAA